MSRAFFLARRFFSLLRDASLEIFIAAQRVLLLRDGILRGLYQFPHLQRIGSAVVRFASGTNIPDAPCGFRAFHSEAALRLNVFGEYTYTLETIIQAGRKSIPIASVPIRVKGSGNSWRSFPIAAS